MQFDFEALAPADRYKIMTATIVPRPIAWVTTVSKSGVRNAAPFSFFNAVGKDPPLVVLGIQPRTDGTMKDTARNILDTGEFVVNLVGEPAAAAMSVTSIEAASDVDELALAGVATEPSAKVGPPRIAGAPVSFECKLHTPLELGPAQLLVVGEVLIAHVADGLVMAGQRHHIDTPRLALIGRMHGRDWYVRTRDLFQLPRP